jgi:hypothetical protein
MSTHQQMLHDDLLEFARERQPEVSASKRPPAVSAREPEARA